jgi:hypothetical protein
MLGDAMRRQQVVMVMAGAAALWCAAPLVAGCAAPAGARQVPASTASPAGARQVPARAAGRAAVWQSAIEVPGTGALNKGGYAVVNSLSCASAGNCAAGGSYTDGSHNRQAFVASETNGTWHAAMKVPGTAVLNKGGSADVISVSCPSVGNCLAGGSYLDRSHWKQAFVASETNGTWHAAVEVPGTAALNKRGDAWVHSLSCPSAGNCAAGGDYRDGSRHYQAFVASEAHGIWHQAIEVPGTGALNKGGFAEVDSVSCASAGNCLAGGDYLSDSSGSRQAFVASQAHGTWHAAIKLPGTGRLNTGRAADVDSVSCVSPGNCTAGGYFTDSDRQAQPFVASEANGTWHGAIDVPGISDIDGGFVQSLSCRSAGSCAAGGSTSMARSGHTRSWPARSTAPGTRRSRGPR